MQSSIIAPLTAALILLTGCSAPKVDDQWLSKNCKPLPRFTPENCAKYTNCFLHGSSCACRYDNGTYAGTLLNGKHHGRGTYTWKDGSKYEGYFKNGNKQCGVETAGTKYAIYKSGSVSKRGDTDSETAALVGAALLIGVAAAAANSGGGGGGCPYAPALWDYQPGNGTWACRRTDNGQYTYDCNCAGQYQVDNWP